MIDFEDDQPRQYKVYFSEGAEAEIEAAFDFLFAKDPNLAYEWRRGLQEITDGLCQMPRRYPLQLTPAQQPAVDIRRLLYRYRGIVYRVTYAIKDSDDDESFVRVLRVRHSSQSD